MDWILFPTECHWVYVLALVSDWSSRSRRCRRYPPHHPHYFTTILSTQHEYKAPFNFPAMIPLWMFPIAIATGNTYILKPTEKAPSASLLLVKYLHEIGLPPGVVNVVNGGKATVDAILTHPDIKAISFVGSNAAGEYIHDVGSKHGKRVQANLGAKNHATVMTKDADRASTIKALVGAAFGAAGQRCMALSVVIFVCDTLEEGNAWANEVVEEARKLKVGNGFEEGVDIGKSQFLSSFVRDAFGSLRITHTSHHSSTIEQFSRYVQDH